MVLMSRAKGQSVLSESIFENRFMHVPGRAAPDGKLCADD